MLFRFLFLLLLSNTMFFNTISASMENQTAEKYVRGSRGWGFFAEFLWVLNHLEYCLSTNKSPVIYWGQQFAYYHPEGYNGSTNCWEYYFEPVSNLKYETGDIIHDPLTYKDDFTTIWWYSLYIQHLGACTKEEQACCKHITTKTVVPEKIRSNHPRGKHLYSEIFRTFVKNELIDRYIKLKPSLAEKLETFYQKNMLGKKTIGIHLRGPHLYREVEYVPLSVMFAEANKFAESENVQFYIATDQYPLIEEARKNLKGNVVYYECERFAHTTSPIAGGAKLHPKLGEDIVLETLLLSRCDHLIHTLSNVSTTALYFNPTLKHTLLY